MSDLYTCYCNFLSHTDLQLLKSHLDDAADRLSEVLMMPWFEVVKFEEFLEKVLQLLDGIRAYATRLGDASSRTSENHMSQG